MLTDEQLHAIMPALRDTARARYLPPLLDALTEFAIESPVRQAAFLAQLAHESGQLRFMEEIWGPTAAQQRYEPRSALSARLGNTEPGDGERFKGRGPIQITGRGNYQRFGDLLHVDLPAEPARAAAPELAFRIAGLFWMKNGLNELADQATGESFQQITRRINGGLNGLAERERFHAVASTVLGVSNGDLTRGARSRAGHAPQPVFERGYEAVRALARPRRSRTSPA